MRKTKLLITFILTSVMLFSAFAFTGCKGSAQPTLTVFTMFGGEDGNKDAYAVGVKKFKEARPDVKLNDQSIQAAEGFDDKVTSRFVNEKESPDVLYMFSPNRNLPIQDKLAKVADIRAKYANYGAGFPEVSGDATTLAFLGNTFGMYYEKSKFNDETDFASFAALRNRLIEIKTATPNALVDAAGEPHYWLNYIGLQKMGKKWADVTVPSKDWFTENRAALVEVLTELNAYLKTDLGMGSSATIEYGNEKQAMWNGNKVFDVNGNWNAAGFYPPHATNGRPDDYHFASLPIDDNAATTDIDESKYILSGFFHGWMISKKCYNDPGKLALAVEFVNKQCQNVLAYGGMAADGSARITDTPLAKATKDIMKTPNAIICMPIDDKFTNATAKSTFYTNVTNMLYGTKTPLEVVNSTIIAF